MQTDPCNHNFRISGPTENGLRAMECTECGLERVG